MPTNQFLQLSKDGSHTIVSEKYQVAYHSMHGALTESNVVFIEAGLDFLHKKNYTSISVFEMGFGTGLNALLAYIWSEKFDIKLIYHTVEAFPLPLEVSEQLNYPSILGHKEVFQKLHTCEWGDEINISSNFIFCKHNRTLETLNLHHKSDVIFFDAFSPASQPELWDSTIMAKMYEMLYDFGILVTYCAQGMFKRNLKAVGFAVESIPGPPGKREMTRAIKNSLMSVDHQKTPAIKL